MYEIAKPVFVADHFSFCRDNGPAAAINILRDKKCLACQRSGGSEKTVEKGIRNEKSAHLS